MTHRTHSTVMLLGCLVAAALGAQGAQPAAIAKKGDVPHNAAREAELLTQVKAPEGFKVSLFAGPPIAMYPTCLASAPDGAIFTCVDPNLSLSAEKGRGRVIRLVDANKDGSADTYTVFAEMDSPRGIVADGKNVYVMHPPVLTAYRDTDGDGIADESDDLVKGLGFDLSFRGADHTTNGITMGIDGWIYIAVGDYSYQAAVGKDGRTIRHRGGSVVRVRPDGTGLEIYATGTRNIYDVAVDPMLRVFSRDNTNDGDGWDTRLHYLAPGGNMGYPMLYMNFADEHMPFLFDYGAGAGTGDLWLHDPGFPAQYDNALYTGDWTKNRVYRHALTPKGASFSAEQFDFLTIPHPTDMVADGASSMYVSSLFGGTFTYIGDSVGYIVRVAYPGQPADVAPSYASLDATRLVATLGDPNAEHRLQAQREILRRGTAGGIAGRLESAMKDKKRPTYARVAAMFTLAQLTGQKAQGAIRGLLSDSTMRAVALRALTDDRVLARAVDSKLVAKSLADRDASVRLQAIAALTRLPDSVARRHAAELVPLTADSDRAVAHVASQAVVAIGAKQAALGALASAAPIRRGALRALQQMHDSSTVSGLLLAASTIQSADAKRDVLGALARLYNDEVAWKGEWWGTKPNFVGPYFAPTAWAESPRIKPALRAGVASLATLADTTEAAALITTFVKNRVLPMGARPLFLQLVASRDPRLGAAADALVGTSTVDASALPLLASLDTTSRALHAAVAQMLAAETSIVEAALPMVARAVRDTLLEAETRRLLLTAVSRMPGRAGLDAAVPLFAALNPRDTSANGPIETGWRRFVGDRRREMESDYFLESARLGTRNERALAYSVLIQLLRSNRTPTAVRNKVAPVIQAAWGDPRSADALAEAITIMKLESQYAEPLAAYRGQLAAPRDTTTREWTQMFNGRDLGDWDVKFATRPLGENYNDTFRVEEGQLRVRYDKWTAFNNEWGHLFFKRPFSYYIVAVEYRFVGEQVAGAGSRNSWAIRNNGIMAHSQSAASMGLAQDFPISLEIQLLGGLGSGNRTTANLCTPGTHVMMGDRLITAHCTNSRSKTYDGDQWVRVEAMVLGDSIIKHIVNGDTVLTYSKPRMGGGNANNTNPGVLVDGKMLSSGYISLQAESAPIDFRKVEILDLVGCMDPKAANYKNYFVKSDPSMCRYR